MKLDAPVSTIMTKKVITVSPDQKLVDLKHIYEKLPFHHHVPVVEKNKLTGMVSLIDFMRVVCNSSLDDNDPIYQNTFVKEIMSEKPESMNGTATIREVAKNLIAGNVHAYVIANKGEVEGIVSYSDVIKYFLKETE